METQRFDSTADTLVLIHGGIIYTTPLQPLLSHIHSGALISADTRSIRTSLLRPKTVCSLRELISCLQVLSLTLCVLWVVSAPEILSYPVLGLGSGPSSPLDLF